MDEESSIGESPEDRLEKFLLNDGSRPEATEEEGEPTQEADAEDAKEGEEGNAEEDLSHDDGIDPALIARALGIDENDLSVAEDGSLRIKTKIDGSVSEVDFAQLRKGFQLEQHANKKSMELSEARKQFEQEAKNIYDQFVEKMHFASQVADYQQKQLDHAFKEINWRELKEYSPTEYYIKRNEFEERQKEINLLNDSLNEDFSFQKEKYEKLRQDAINENRKEQIRLLKEKDRDFEKDETWKNVGEYLGKNGFKDKDFDNLMDNHNFMLIVRKAMAHDSGKEKVDVAKKKLVKLPKVLKPGTGERKEGDWKNDLDKAKKRGGRMSSKEAERILMKMI